MQQPLMRWMIFHCKGDHRPELLGRHNDGEILKVRADAMRGQHGRAGLFRLDTFDELVDECRSLSEVLDDGGIRPTAVSSVRS
jgi:hypothetical protein